MSSKRQKHKERQRKAAADRSRVRRQEEWVSPVKADCKRCQGTGFVLDRNGIKCACPTCYHVPEVPHAAA